MKRLAFCTAFLWMFFTSTNSILWAQGQGLYWGYGGKIKRMNPDGSDVSIVLEPIFKWPHDIRFESGEGKLYWCNSGGPAIQRSNPDGTNFEEIYKNPNIYPYSIAIHPITGKIFWLGSDGGLYEFSLDEGSNELRGNFNPNWYCYQPEFDIEIDPSCGESGCLFWAALICNDDNFYFTSTLYKTNLNDFHSEAICSFPFPILDISIDLIFHRVYFVVFGWDGVVWLYSMELDGSDLRTEFSIPGGTYSIYVDGLAQKIYWLSYDETVFRANFDGSLQEQVLMNEELQGASNFVVRPEESKIYFANAGESKIQFTNLSLGTTQTILDPLFVNPANVAIDPIHQKMYWTDNERKSIFRANLDGTEVESIYTLPSSNHPLTPFFEHIAFSLSESKIYWSECHSDNQNYKLRKAGLDGSNPVTVTEIGFPPENPSTLFRRSGPIAFDTSSGKLYWSISSRPYSNPASAPASGEILRLNPDGSELETFLSFTWEGPIESNGIAIAVDSEQGWIYYQNPDPLMRRIERRGVNGIGVQLVTPANAHFLELDLLEQRIYWLDELGSIRRKSLGTGGIVQELYDGDRPSSIAFLQFPSIVSSNPPSCSIDARQTNHMEDEMIRYGWVQLDLQYAWAVPVLSPIDFSISQFGSSQIAPTIQSVQPVEENTVRLNFSHALQPGAWTCITSHYGSGEICLGYLPGDINADGQVNPSDILYLIDNLNGVVQPSSPIWQTDINRSGSAEPSDILRLIDLLNGAGAFIPWNGASLPACPN